MFNSGVYAMSRYFFFELSEFTNRPFPNFLDQTGLIFIKVTKQIMNTNTKLQATAFQKPPNLGILTKLSAAKAAYNPTTDQYILLK
jgi:hypothetical protein